MPVGHVWPLWALKKKKKVCVESLRLRRHLGVTAPPFVPTTDRKFDVLTDVWDSTKTFSHFRLSLTSKDDSLFFLPPFFTCQGHWAFIAKSNRCLWLPSPWIRSLIIEWWIPHFCVLWVFFFFCFLPVHERAPACVLCVCLFAHFHHHIFDELADLSLFPATSSTRLEDLSFLDNPRAGGHRGSVRKHNTAERTNEDAKGTL